MSHVGTMQPPSGTQFSTAARNLLNIEKDIEKRIKREVWQKNIRVREFFYDFDRLRKGCVQEDKFRTAVSMFGIYMTKEDIDELIKRYRTADGTVRYDDFCHNIDEQFYDHSMAKDNLEATQSKAIYTEEENYIVIKALRQFKHTIKTKRILLKQPFMDFDKTKCSHVTKEQFGRVLTQLGFLLEQNKFDILARRYMDNGNTKEVNYVKFCKDVDDVQEYIASVSSNESKNKDTSFIPNDVVSDVQNLNIMSTLYSSKRLAPELTNIDVERKIQADVVMRQIRIQEFFHDFDGLRKGTISETQFRRVLNMSGIVLGEEEFAALMSKYQMDNKLVRYVDFVENINKVFTTKGIDKDPLYQVPQIDHNTTLAARRKFFDMREDEYQKFVDLIQLYRQQISNRRVLMKPHFQDFDKTNTGHISKNQFLRILNQFGLFPNEEAVNLILKRYIDKGNLEEVNYYDFCNDVDSLFEDGKEISKTHAESFKIAQPNLHELKTHILNDKPNDLEDLIARLRKRVKQLRIRVHEFLRDFDKLRTGGITINQLHLGLNMANLPLSGPEFQLLVANFRMEKKDGYVKWKDLCDTIEEVFTVKALEKTPWSTVNEPNLTYSYGKQPMTQDEVATAEKVKRRFKNFSRGTRLDIKQFFQDWDKLGRNKVSPKQFRQVLATVNFTLSDNEFSAIVKYYFSDEDKDVRYVDFINDTNPNKPDDRSPSPTDSPTQPLVENPPSPNKHNSLGLSAIGLTTSQVVTNVDPGLLLERIKNQVKTCQLRVGEYFKDYDPLRKGAIPTNKFRGVLSKMKIELTEVELQTLERMYAFSTNEYPYKVDYTRFIDDVDIVFTKTGLEKDPLIKPEAFNPPAYLDPQSILTDYEERRLHEFMLKLGEVVFKHRILIKPFFQDKDKSNCGKILFTRFRAVLDVLKLPIGDEDFRILCKRFGFEGKEFNYVEFMEVLKNYSERD